MKNTHSTMDAGLDEPCDFESSRGAVSLSCAESKVPKPVFIVGCPRSGTTLLYDMLLSSGKFASYRAESDVFFRIAPAFGNLKSWSNRRRLMDAWLKSDYFRRTGLNAARLRAMVLSRCRNPGDFLRIVMEALAREQGVHRWADNTPFHLLYIAEIKKTIPDAQFVHIIRDGRDVAMSLSRLGWPPCFPWDSKHRLEILRRFPELTHPCSPEMTQAF
jgi:hypothetical protein